MIKTKLIRAGVFLAGFGFVAGATLFAFAWFTVSIPDPNAYVNSQSTIIQYSNGSEIGRIGTQNRQILPLAKIPLRLRYAVMAAEDRNFYSNRAFSATGIARALLNNLKSGSLNGEGGSTITQQYAKTAFLTPSRTIQRKIKELVISLKLENALTKDQILENYLNTIYFGRGSYGVQTAAQQYFNRNANQLSISQSAVIASILRSPGYYDPVLSKENAKRLEGRFGYVIQGMLDKKWITEAEAKAAEEARLKAEAEAKAKAEEDARLAAIKKAEEEARAKAEADRQAQIAKDKAAEEARILAEQKAKEAEAARIKAEEDRKIAEQKALTDGKITAEDTKKVLDNINSDGKVTQAEVKSIVEAIKQSDAPLTVEQKDLIATVVIAAAVSSGENVTATQIQDAGIEYKDLPKETPVEVRTSESGEPLVITAEVAANVELVTDAGALLEAAFTDPGAALAAIGSIGADMTEGEREEATDMVVATVVAAGAAMNAVGAAAGSTGGSSSGSSSGGGSGGGGASGNSKGVRRRP